MKKKIGKYIDDNAFGTNEANSTRTELMAVLIYVIFVEEQEIVVYVQKNNLNKVGLFHTRTSYL